MAALTTERDTRKRGPHSQLDELDLPVAASAIIYAGALVCLNAAGYAVPGATATTLTAAGRAEETVDNGSGANGDKRIKVFRGVFKYANLGADQIVQADLLKQNCYVVDDQTVAKTNGTNTRSLAGTVMDIDSDGVWVKVGAAI